MPFYVLVLTLSSKVDLIWTRAVQLVIVQSVPFSKIAKKLNIAFCQFFSHWKEALFLLKSWNKKWGSPYSFLRQRCRKCAPHAFSPIIERALGRVSKWHVCGRGNGLNVQSFRQMYWNLRDYMSNLRWTDHELWLIADPPISLIDSFIDWFKLLLVNFLRFSFSVAISLWTRTNSFYFFDIQVLTS